jgi:hypothetical protein
VGEQEALSHAGTPKKNTHLGFLHAFLTKLLALLNALLGLLEALCGQSIVFLDVVSSSEAEEFRREQQSHTSSHCCRKTFSRWYDSLMNSQRWVVPELSMVWRLGGFQRTVLPHPCEP